MVNKRTYTKEPLERIWWDNNSWSVVYGELRRPPGHPGKKENLFKYIGEKIPFDALDKIEEKLKEKEDKVEGVYIAHDSMGTPRYSGRGNIFARLNDHRKKHPIELVYFSFFVIEDKKHEREIETLLIRVAGPLLEFNKRKKRVGISPGDVKDYEAGTFYFERQKKKGPRKA